MNNNRGRNKNVDKNLNYEHRRGSASSTHNLRKKQGIISRLKAVVENISDRSSNKKNSSKPPIFYIAIFSLVLIIFSSILGTVWMLTNKNAFEVFINEESVGIIKKGDSITSDYIKTLSFKKLQSDFGGTNIEVYDTISITPIHAKKKEIVDIDIVTAEICKKFTYKVEAFSITVDGIEMAIILSKVEAEEILDNIKNKYIPEGMNVVPELTTFVEVTTIQSKFVNKEEITTKDAAYEILSKTLDSELIYEVKSGDTLSKIAAKNNFPLEEIFKLNTDLNTKSILKIGQKITLSVPKPLLSVKTVEEQKLIEIKPKVIKIQDNPREKKGVSRVIVQGKDGQHEVTIHITRINGFEVSREEINSVITVPPVDEIIEKGSK